MESIAPNFFIPDESKSALKHIARDDDDQFKLELLKVDKLTHDTCYFTFKLPSEDQVLGLPVGGFLFFHLEHEGQMVTKRYTPVSSIIEKGIARFVIKIYRPNEEFPKGGKGSQCVEKKQVGETITMEGPKGMLAYQGFGKFLIKKVEQKKTKVGLLAGGTGITPCFQLIQSSSLAKDGLSIVLLYSNKTKDDILTENELNHFAEVNGENFKMFHTLTRHDDGKHGEWKGLKGRVSAEMIKQCGFPEPTPETLICHCGPAAFNKTVVDTLKEMGYTDDMIFKF